MILARLKVLLNVLRKVLEEGQCDPLRCPPLAQVAEQADATVSNTVVRKDMWVQVPPWAPLALIPSFLGGSADVYGVGVPAIWPVAYFVTNSLSADRVTESHDILVSHAVSTILWSSVVFGATTTWA